MLLVESGSVSRARPLTRHRVLGAGHGVGETHRYRARAAPSDSSRRAAWPILTKSNAIDALVSKKTCGRYLSMHKKMGWGREKIRRNLKPSTLKIKTGDGDCLLIWGQHSNGFRTGCIAWPPGRFNCILEDGGGRYHQPPTCFLTVKGPIMWRLL